MTMIVNLTMTECYARYAALWAVSRRQPRCPKSWPCDATVAASARNQATSGPPWSWSGPNTFQMVGANAVWRISHLDEGSGQRPAHAESESNWPEPWVMWPAPMDHAWTSETCPKSYTAACVRPQAGSPPSPCERERAGSETYKLLARVPRYPSARPRRHQA